MENAATETEKNHFTATYSPDDNKIRLSCAVRIDSDTFARLKASGYKWAPKQEQMIAPMWTPAREDIALELAGEIGDDDTTLAERAEVRAERFEEYSEKRAKDADRAHNAVEAIAGNIPFGQPILIGHHSQRRAERDAQKIENGMKRAVSLWETSKYWEQRAAGALHHAKYKELPAVRARRIKGIEADKRKLEKETKQREQLLAMWTAPDKELTMERALMITNGAAGYLSFCFTLDKYPRSAPASQYEGPMSLWSALEGGVITPEQARDLSVRAYTAGNKNRARWVAHYDNRLTYEKAMLNEQGAAHLIEKKPRPKQLPICNYKQESFTLPHRWTKGQTETLEQVELTSEQYSAIYADNRGTREVDGTHRIRIAVVPKDGEPRYKAKYCAIYITDGKTHKKPESAAKEVAPKPMPSFREPTPSQEIYAEAREAVKVDRSEQAAKFDGLQQALKSGVKALSAPQLFPTPEALAQRVVDAADIRPGDRVLEPSAGTGALLKALPCVRPNGAVVAVEISSSLIYLLEPWADDIRCTDFLQCNGDLGKFDKIIMNPPFANQQDIDHVTHALKFLNDGGKLVAIMSAGVEFRQDKKAQSFRDLVERMGGTIEALPAGSFEQSGTGVNTVLVEICK